MLVVALGSHVPVVPEPEESTHSHWLAVIKVTWCLLGRGVADPPIQKVERLFRE